MFSENLDILSVVGFKLHKLSKEWLLYFDKLTNVDFFKIFVWESLTNQPVDEKLQFFLMLFRSGEHQKRLWKHRHLCMVCLSILEIIQLVLPKNVYLSPWSSFSIVYPPCDVLYMLHNKVNRHSIVPKTWNYYVSVNHRWQDEVSEGVLYEFVVLQ